MTKHTAIIRYTVETEIEFDTDNDSHNLAECRSKAMENSAIIVNGIIGTAVSCSYASAKVINVTECQDV